MIENWSSDVLSPDIRERFFVDMINREFCACEVDAPNGQTGFSSHLQKIHLGDVSVIHYNGAGAQRAQRRLRHSRSDDTDDVCLYLPVTANIDMEQCGRNVTMTPGTCAFVSMARPFTGILYREDQSPYAAIHAKIPGPLLRDRIARIDRHFNQLVPVGKGTGRIMQSLLSSVISEAEHIDSTEARIVGDTVIDAIASAVHAGLVVGSEETFDYRSQHRQLAREKVERYALAHLSNPELTTLRIARECGMSLRHLHSLFEGTPWTAANWIREQRLQRCRRSLRSAELRHSSVTEIAYMWGFKDGSHFSRAYKSRFGINPSLDRAEK